MADNEIPMRAGKVRVARWLGFVFVCAIIQQLVPRLAVADKILWKMTFGNWLSAALGALILIAMARVVVPFYRSAIRYARIFFRLDFTVRGRNTPRVPVVLAGTGLVLVVLEAVLYWTVWPVAISLASVFYGFDESLLKADLAGRTVLIVCAIGSLIVLFAGVRRLFKHLDAVVPQGPA